MNRRFTSAALTGAALIALTLAGCDSAELTGVTADGRGNDNHNNRGVTTAVESAGHTGSVELLADQNTVVGSVSWETNDDGTVDVTYQTLAGYCITEWHLDGGTGNGFGIPLNNGGNPMLGNFQYGAELPEGECESTIMQTLQPKDFEGEGDRILAAHAVVEDDEGNCNVFYGISADGAIYEIRLDHGAGTADEDLFFQTGLDGPVGTTQENNWPNSIAYYPLTDRLYYSNSTAIVPPTGEGEEDPTAPLYFYDFGGANVAPGTFAGNLTRRSASGEFVGDTFYYVPQSVRDNLRGVTFNPDGTIASRELVCEHFTGIGGNIPMEFGDLVYVDGLLYGSAKIPGVPETVFFSLDLTMCDGIGGADDSDAYTVIARDLPQLQLTQDCDGNIIGFAAGTGTYYVVQTDGTAVEVASTTLPFDSKINDLARGRCDCPPDFDETAWGRGQRFQDRGSWAMYINIGPAPEQED